jgi:hypothetical protein
MALSTINSMDPRDRELHDHVKRGELLTNVQVKEIECCVSDGSDALGKHLELFGYYSKKRSRDPEAMKHYLETVLWLIENCPNNRWLGLHISRSSFDFPPRQFGNARELWLKQIEKYPGDPIVKGNAGIFIVCRDLELAEKLLVTANEQDGINDWLGFLVSFLYYEFSKKSLHIYRAEYAKKTIELGWRAIKLGSSPSLITLAYMAECGLFLGDQEMALNCARELRNEKDPLYHRTASAINGLVEIRRKNVRKATKFLLEIENEIEAQHLVLQLASEIYDGGEGLSVVRWLSHYRGRGPKKKWISLIKAGRKPDFEDS